MRHLVRIVVVACIALTAWAVDAAPRHHAKVFKKKQKAKHHSRSAHFVVKRADGTHVRIARKDDDDDVRITDDADDDDDDTEERTAKPKTHKVAKVETEEEGDEAGDDVSDEEATDDVYEERDDVEPVAVHKSATAKKPWSFAFGPYVWASSVDAQASLGGASVAAGIDFIDITRHTKFGMEMLGEARYRKLIATGDLTYAIVALNGTRDVGPFMVTVDGRAGTLLADGTVGYQIGGDDSKIAFEPRVGLRYRRTDVAMKVGLNDNMVTPPAIVTSSKDGLIGARVFVRPSKRFYLSTTGDLGVFGDSSKTWSAAVDASLHVSKYVLVSAGYRTLTTDSPTISLTMHGPRFAVEATF